MPLRQSQIIATPEPEVVRAWVRAGMTEQIDQYAAHLLYLEPEQRAVEADKLAELDKRELLRLMWYQLGYVADAFGFPVEADE